MEYSLEKQHLAFQKTVEHFLKQASSIHVKELCANGDIGGALPSAIHPFGKSLSFLLPFGKSSEK